MCSKCTKGNHIVVYSDTMAPVLLDVRPMPLLVAASDASLNAATREIQGLRDELDKMHAQMRQMRRIKEIIDEALPHLGEANRLLNSMHGLFIDEDCVDAYLRLMNTVARDVPPMPNEAEYDAVKFLVLFFEHGKWYVLMHRTNYDDESKQLTTVPTIDIPEGESFGKAYEARVLKQLGLDASNIACRITYLLCTDEEDYSEATKIIVYTGLPAALPICWNEYQIVEPLKHSPNDIAAGTMHYWYSVDDLEDNEDLEDKRLYGFLTKITKK